MKETRYYGAAVENFFVVWPIEFEGVMRIKLKRKRVDVRRFDSAESSGIMHAISEFYFRNVAGDRGGPLNTKGKHFFETDDGRKVTSLGGGRYEILDGDRVIHVQELTCGLVK